MAAKKENLPQMRTGQCWSALHCWDLLVHGWSYLILKVREQEISQDVYLDRGRTGRDLRQIWDLLPRSIQVVDPSGRSLVKTVQKKKGPQNGHSSLRSEVEEKGNSKKGVKLRRRSLLIKLREAGQGRNNWQIKMTSQFPAKVILRKSIVTNQLSFPVFPLCFMMTF